MIEGSLALPLNDLGGGDRGNHPAFTGSHLVIRPTLEAYLCHYLPGEPWASPLSLEPRRICRGWLYVVEVWGRQQDWLTHSREGVLS